MCLGVPGRVVEVDGFEAVVDFWGVRRRVRLEVVDQPVAAGDYILNHVGFAIRRIPDGEIEETLALYETLLDAANRNATSRDATSRDATSRDATNRDAAGEDMMAEDVRGEMAATAPAAPEDGAEEAPDDD